ncbi:MAG: hypothetical protein J0G96_04470 [Flavobacteriia bacterium]|nr:hypothetical protein [Flavobacteriia bacterium]OJX37024.1 MAG: hypothetical protein BGO87_14700 [Flavobacteriia bacterium 40-80]
MVNLFVSRLDYGVTQENLIALFKPYGYVRKVVIPTDKETGKTKGFAFVEIDSNDADTIISDLDGYSLNNRSISVKIAEERGDRPQRPANNNGDRPQRPYNNTGDRRPFNNQERRPEQRNEYKTSDEPAKPANFFPPSDGNALSAKNDRTKKDNKKKGSGASDGPKKNKMEAYKKSGKQNRFFYDDDEDFDY